jgi:hypothetical protein
MSWQEQYERDKAANAAERAFNDARHAPARAEQAAMTAQADAAWDRAERRAAQLRDEGDEAGARDLLRSCGELYGADPRGAPSTQRGVELFQERETARASSRRQLDAGDVDRINDERNRAGLPPVNSSTLALAGRLGGQERPERKRRRTGR